MPDAMRVPGAVFRAGGPPPFAVLGEDGENVLPVLADPARRESLAHAALTVAAEHTTDFRSYLLRALPRVAGNRDVEDHIRAWTLHCSLRFEVEAVLLAEKAPPYARGLIEVTRALGREGVSWSGTGKLPSYRHRDLVGTEYTAVAHAVNGALYATSLGAAAGERSHEALQGAALAAVFADVGLEHPTDAARIDQAVVLMRRAGVVSVGAAAGVLGRLSRWDGTGVPPGAAGPSIPFEARCVAIACDYDLHTLTGAYSQGLSPYEALSAMSRRSGAYDPSLLRVLVLLIAKTTGELDQAHVAPPARQQAAQQAAQQWGRLAQAIG